MWTFNKPALVALLLLLSATAHGDGITGPGGPAPPSILSYGAVSSPTAPSAGVQTANVAAFAAAAVKGGLTIIPCGNYYINDRITMAYVSLPPTKFVGAGSGCVNIISTVAAQPIFYVNPNQVQVQISGMTLDRTVAATSGGDGIDYSNTGDEQWIFDIKAINQWNGFHLGPTGVGRLENSSASQNYNNGIYLADDTFGAGTTLQWWISDFASTQNNGNDVEIYAAHGGTPLGQFTNLITYASSGSCIYAHADAGSSLDGLKVIGGFLGSSGNHCIRTSTRSGNHSFTGVSIELIGNAGTGRGQATAATHVGDCFNFDSTEDLIAVTAVYCNQPWGNGLTTSATLTHITGGTFQNARGAQGGVYVATAGKKVTLTGTNSGNNGGALQQYGVFAANGADVTLVGGSYVGNAIAAFGATVNGNANGNFPTAKIINSTRDLTVATGNVSYTGLGFRPTSCVAHGNAAAIAYNSLFGFSDSTRASRSITTFGAAANVELSTGLLAFFDSTNTNAQQATVASYDADGLTLTWTKTGTPTGTATFYIMCYR